MRLDTMVAFMGLRRRTIWRRTLINTAIFIYIALWVFALFNYSSRTVTQISPEVSNKVFRSRYCSVDTDKLGIEDIDVFTVPEMNAIEDANTAVSLGGKWIPSNCKPWQKVAVIIPCRDRRSHLQILLNHLHRFLQKQKRFYQIFVVEQDGSERFNHGHLANIGVYEALKVENFDCFVFHDVDLLPENSQNIYYCDENARHLSASIDEMRYNFMYYNQVGGVVSINRENFFKVNGYSSGYWGWGNEDDDFAARIMEFGLRISRPPRHIGRFKMVRHIKSWRAENGYELFRAWRSRWKTDGINSTAGTYEITKYKQEKLYTWLLVKLGKTLDKIPLDDSVERESWWWIVKFFFL